MRVVVLGVGNLLRRDDGVGVHAVRELARRYRFPEQVRLVDGRVAGPALLGALEGADALVAVDAVRGGAPPGTLYRLPGEALPAAGAGPAWTLHEAGLPELVALARQASPGLRVTVLGVEPLDTTSWGLELTAPVAVRLPQLVGLVLEELASLGIAWEEAAPADAGAPGAASGRATTARRAKGR